MDAMTPMGDPGYLSDNQSDSEYSSSSNSEYFIPMSLMFSVHCFCISKTHLYCFHQVGCLVLQMSALQSLAAANQSPSFPTL